MDLPNTKPEGTEQRKRLFQTQDSRVVSNFALQTTLPGPPGLKLLRTFCQGSPQLRRPCPPMGRPWSWVDTNGRQPRTEGTRRVFLLPWPMAMRLKGLFVKRSFSNFSTPVSLRADKNEPRVLGGLGQLHFPKCPVAERARSLGQRAALRVSDTSLLFCCCLCLRKSFQRKCSMNRDDGFFGFHFITKAVRFVTCWWSEPPKMVSMINSSHSYPKCHCYHINLIVCNKSNKIRANSGFLEAATWSKLGG